MLGQKWRKGSSPLFSAMNKEIYYKFSSIKGWTTAIEYSIYETYKYPNVGEFVPGLGVLTEKRIKDIIYIVCEN